MNSASQGRSCGRGRCLSGRSGRGGRGHSPYGSSMVPYSAQNRIFHPQLRVYPHDE